MVVCGQRHAPAALPPGKLTRYPLYRRLGGRQGRYGQVRKISHPPGFDLRTVRTVVSSYTDWAIPAPFKPGVLTFSMQWTTLRVWWKLWTPSERNMFKSIKIVRFIDVNERIWSPEDINYIVAYTHSGHKLHCCLIHSGPKLHCCLHPHRP